MENVIVFNETGVKPKKLYRIENRFDNSEAYFIGDCLKDLLDEAEYAFVGERKYIDGSGGDLEDILHSLVEKENISYITEYTPEELFDEVADDWDSLAEYMFGSKVSGKSLEQAYNHAREHGIEDGDLSEIVSILLGKKVSLHISRGYSQGDYAEAYFVADSESEREYLGGLFDGWAFGVYSLLGYIDENDEVVGEAIVLDYTPAELVGKKYEVKREAIEAEALKQLGLEEFVGKVGTAEARKVYSWKYEKKEAEEK